MVRRELALVSVLLLLWCSLAEARSTQTPGLTPAGMRERLTLIPGGAVVEVKLARKRKIRGRLGTVSESGFEVQHTQDNRIVTEILPFEDVRSVKVVGKGMHFVPKVMIGTLVAIGVVALVGVALCATAGCTD